MDTEKLSEMKTLAGEMQSEGAALMDPGTRVKKPRGPYKKKTENSEPKKVNKTKVEAKDSPEKAPQAAPVEIPTKQVLLPVLEMLSGACESYAGHPQARMKPDEKDAIADLLSALIDKYAPDALNKYGLEVTCVFVLGQYGYRVIQTKRAVDASKKDVPKMQTFTADVVADQQAEPATKMTIVEKTVDFEKPGIQAEVHGH